MMVILGRTTHIGSVDLQYGPFRDEIEVDFSCEHSGTCGPAGW
jgi:hypothetical protein